MPNNVDKQLSSTLDKQHAVLRLLEEHAKLWQQHQSLQADLEATHGGEPSEGAAPMCTLPLGTSHEAEGMSLPEAAQRVAACREGAQGEEAAEDSLRAELWEVARSLSRAEEQQRTAEAKLVSVHEWYRVTEEELRTVVQELYDCRGELLVTKELLSRTQDLLAGRGDELCNIQQRLCDTQPELDNTMDNTISGPSSLIAKSDSITQHGNIFDEQVGTISDLRVMLGQGRADLNGQFSCVSPMSHSQLSSQYCAEQSWAIKQYSPISLKETSEVPSYITVHLGAQSSGLEVNSAALGPKPSAPQQQGCQPLDYQYQAVQSEPTSLTEVTHGRPQVEKSSLVGEHKLAGEKTDPVMASEQSALLQEQGAVKAEVPSLHQQDQGWKDCEVEEHRDLSERLRVLQQAHAELDSEFRGLDVQHRSTAKDLALIRRQDSALRAKLTQNLAQLQDQHDALYSLQRQHALCGTELEAAVHEAQASFQEELDLLKRKYSNLQRQHRSVVEAESVARKAAAAKETSTANLLEAANQKLKDQASAALEAERVIKELRGDVATASKALEDALSGTENAVSEAVEASEDAAAAHEELDLLQELFNELQGQHNELQTRYAGAEHKHSDPHNGLGDLQQQPSEQSELGTAAELETLRQHNSDLQQQHNELQMQYQEVQLQCSEQGQHYRKIQAQHSDLVASEAALRADLKTLEQQHAACAEQRSQLEEACQELDHLRLQASGLQDARGSMEEAQRAAEQQHSAAQVELCRVKEELALCEENASSTRKQLCAAHDVTEKLREGESTLSVELEKLQVQHSEVLLRFDELQAKVLDDQDTGPMQTVSVTLSFEGDLADLPVDSKERCDFVAGVEEGVAATMEIPLCCVRLNKLTAGR